MQINSISRISSFDVLIHSFSLQNWMIKNSIFLSTKTFNSKTISKTLSFFNSFCYFFFAKKHARLKKHNFTNRLERLLPIFEYISKVLFLLNVESSWCHFQFSYLNIFSNRGDVYKKSTSTSQKYFSFGMLIFDSWTPWRENIEFL